MSPDGIEVTAPEKLTIDAPIIEVTSTQITITASTITVDSPMVQFSGIVQSEVLQTSQVISQSYTNGEGNLL